MIYYTAAVSGRLAKCGVEFFLALKLAGIVGIIAMGLKVCVGAWDEGLEGQVDKLKDADWQIVFDMDNFELELRTRNAKVREERTHELVWVRFEISGR